MSLPLDSATMMHALEIEVTHEPISSAETVAGSPTAGFVALTTSGDLELGVWEITAGVVNAVEEAEIFIVLRGRATLRRGDGTEVELTLGSVARLTEGEKTQWTVHETLRKVYLA
jgi:uncharacterized cupin superfamily protein